ncbi:MAG: hypothetical protein ACD_48C00252G0003 [uncultured bacterium]|nr:MAG: hypothetical protein ACD_48C00252G0003 [uncultured bacterium]
MESYIQISKINDFLFCPRSLYLHTIYDTFHKETYHRTPQVAGTLAHQTINKGTYSSEKKYLIGIDVYSDDLGVCGKIDIYDKETKTLIERKKQVKHIYDGYKYQLYAQMTAMQEMGYEVEKLLIHSLADNTRYDVPLPDKVEWNTFVSIVDRMKEFSAKDAGILQDSAKCAQCIYQPLCHPL